MWSVFPYSARSVVVFSVSGYCPRLSRSVVLPQASLPPQKWSLNSETYTVLKFPYKPSRFNGFYSGVHSFIGNFITILGKAADRVVQGLRNVSWAGRGRPALGQFPTWETRGKLGLVQLSQKTSETVTRDGENITYIHCLQVAITPQIIPVLRSLLTDNPSNWTIADWRVPSNDPRYNCEMHFDFSFFLVSKVAKIRITSKNLHWLDRCQITIERFHMSLWRPYWGS